MKRRTQTAAPQPAAPPPLPDGVLKTDLKYGHARVVASFEMWFTPAFGWCIPTLLIQRGRRGYADRTYAVRVSDGQTVRIGLGPHVTQQLHVWVHEARRAALQKFIDLKQSGAGRAGEIRDRISTRRAQTEMRRRSIFDI